MVTDATALGGLFLLVVIVSAYFGDGSIATTTVSSPGIAIIGAIGAISLGTALSLLSDVFWRGFGPFHGRSRLDAAAAYPATARRVVEHLKNPDERAVVVAAYEFHRDDGGAQGWVGRRYAAFGASVNAMVAIGCGLATSALLVPAWTPGRIVVFALFALMGAWRFRDGRRQLREADALELAWLSEHAPGPAGL